MVILKNKKYDIVGIGNAIVDLIAEVDDSYLKKNTITKGSMSLVDMMLRIELVTKLISSKLFLEVLLLIQ